MAGSSIAAGVAGCAVSVPRGQPGEEWRDGSPISRLHAGGNPLPAGKPGSATHCFTGSGEATGGTACATPDIRFGGDAAIRCGQYARPRAISDEDLLNHVRATAGTTFHQTSTCMMAPGADARGGYHATGKANGATAGDRGEGGDMALQGV